MEFFNQGKKFTPGTTPTFKTMDFTTNDKIPAVKHTATDSIKPEANYGNLRDLQLSLLHTRGTLVAGLEYINNLNGETFSIENWTKMHPMILGGEKTLTERERKQIMKFLDMGFFKIRATNTLEGKGGLKEWLRQQNWNLDISGINLNSRDFLVAARSTINSLHWSNLQGNMQMEKKAQLGYNTMQIKNGKVYKDGLGNTLGIYFLDYRGNKLSVRITDLTYSSNSYEEVMINHRNDTGFTKVEGASGFCFAPFKIKLTSSTMRAIQGAELGGWQVIAVAGDGILQINHQQPCNYDLKTIALIHYRSFSMSNNIPQMVNLFHESNGKIRVTFLVELFLDGSEILAVMGNQDDLC